jgi:acetolactate synthase regulatory subunit
MANEMISETLDNFQRLTRLPPESQICALNSSRQKPSSRICNSLFLDVTRSVHLFATQLNKEPTD